MNRLLRLLVAGCVLILAGSARAQADASSDAPPDGPADAAATYQVGPRDVLHIAVFQEESLTGDYTVSEAGDIDFPLVGKVAVERDFRGNALGLAVGIDAAVVLAA